MFPVHISTHHSKHIWGQSWTQHISADTIQDTSRAKVGPSTCQLTSFETYLGPKLDSVNISRHSSKHILGQSWTQHFSGVSVQNTSGAKVGHRTSQQTTFKTHLGTKLDPAHSNRYSLKQTQGRSWTQCISAVID